MSVFSSGAKTVKAFIEDIDLVMRAIPNYLASLAVIDTQGRQRINVETGTLASVATVNTVTSVTTVGTVTSVSNVVSLNGINPVNTFALEGVMAEQLAIRSHLSFY